MIITSPEHIVKLIHATEQWVIITCSLYKGMIQAPLALFSVHLTSSLEDWGQGKFTCHPKRNIFISH